MAMPVDLDIPALHTGIGNHLFLDEANQLAHPVRGDMTTGVTDADPICPKLDCAGVYFLNLLRLAPSRVFGDKHYRDVIVNCEGHGGFCCGEDPLHRPAFCELPDWACSQKRASLDLPLVLGLKIDERFDIGDYGSNGTSGSNLISVLAHVP